MQQQEKAFGFAIQLSSNLLSSKAASLRGRPVFPCLLCVPNDSSQCEPPDSGRLGPRSAGGCRRCNLQQPTLGRSAKGAHNTAQIFISG